MEEPYVPTPEPMSAPGPAPQMSSMPPSAEFKPNIYPIMYWALAFGVAAGVLLLVLQLLARYITIVWLPVFLAGLIYGAYRNYQKQKAAWTGPAGVSTSAGSPWDEFKQAAGDIATATQDLIKEEAPPIPDTPSETIDEITDDTIQPTPPDRTPQP